VHCAVKIKHELVCIIEMHAYILGPVPLKNQIIYTSTKTIAYFFWTTLYMLIVDIEKYPFTSDVSGCASFVYLLTYFDVSMFWQVR